MPFEARKTKLENLLSLGQFSARAAVSANQNARYVETLLYFKITHKDKFSSMVHGVVLIRMTSEACQNFRRNVPLQVLPSPEYPALHVQV